MTRKELVPLRFRRPQWKKPEEKKAMSVLIGIICPDSIVLATDSQITDMTTGEVSYVDKISIIDFLGDQVLVAQGGLWPLTNRVVEIMREKSQELKITNASSVTQLVEDSIRGVKKHLDEEQKVYIERNQTGFLLAFYVGKKPHLYTVNCCGSGIVNPAEKHYAVMEVLSSGLASYLLNEYTLPKSHSDLAIASSIFVVSKVKEHQKALCGGDTNIKHLIQSPVFVSLGMMVLSIPSSGQSSPSLRREWTKNKQKHKLNHVPGLTHGLNQKSEPGQQEENHKKHPRWSWARNQMGNPD